MNIAISHRGFDLRPETKDQVTEKFQRLAKLHIEVHTVHVDLSQDHHHRQGNVFEARAMVTTNTGQVHAEERGERIDLVVDAVVSELMAQLEKMKERHGSPLRPERRRKRWWKSIFPWMGKDNL